MPRQRSSAAFQTSKRKRPASYVGALGRCIKLSFTARGLVFFHPQASYGLIIKTTKETSCRLLLLVKLPKTAPRFFHVSSARKASEGIVNTKLDQKPRCLPKNMYIHNDGVCELDSSSLKTSLYEVDETSKEIEFAGRGFATYRPGATRWPTGESDVFKAAPP